MTFQSICTVGKVTEETGTIGLNLLQGESWIRQLEAFSVQGHTMEEAGCRALHFDHRTTVVTISYCNRGLL